ARFMGMIASRPSCIYLPAHSTPGLIVPVVGPLPSVGLLMDTSTSGISRLNGSERPTSFTNDCRYRRLYWTANPKLIALGFFVVASVPSSATTVVLDFVGTATPRLPVTANGFRYGMLSGRSPKPLPAKIVGVRVLNVSSPMIRFAPVLPISQSSPTDMMV